MPDGYITVSKALQPWMLKQYTELHQHWEMCSTLLVLIATGWQHHSHPDINKQKTEMEWQRLCFNQADMLPAVVSPPGWSWNNGRGGAAALFDVSRDLHAAEAHERHKRRKHSETQRDPKTHQTPTVLLPETEEDAHGQSPSIGA